MAKKKLSKKTYFVFNEKDECDYRLIVEELKNLDIKYSLYPGHEEGWLISKDTLLLSMINTGNSLKFSKGMRKMSKIAYDHVAEMQVLLQADSELENRDEKYKIIENVSVATKYPKLRIQQ